MNKLSSREMQVLYHGALGQTQKEIASTLEISIKTVQKHIGNIFNKSTCVRCMAAVVWERRYQLEKYEETYSGHPANPSDSLLNT